MEVLIAALYGFIHGLTEFLPVSSSGILSLLNSYLPLGLASPDFLLFDSVLHLGSLSAVIIMYRKEILKIVTGTSKLMRGEPEYSGYGGPMIVPARQTVLILIATAPMLLVAFIYRYLAELFSMPGFVIFAFAVNIMIVLSARRFINPGTKKANTMTYTDALYIGIAQACAAIPGISRTALTYTCALSCGLTRQYAFEFSMLMSVPVMTGSFIMSLGSALSHGAALSALPVYITGFAVSAAASYAVIRLISRLLAKDRHQEKEYPLSA